MGQWGRERRSDQPELLNYPTPIPNWTKDRTQGSLYAATMSQSRPEDKVLGLEKISRAHQATIQDILAGKVSVQSGLAALNPQRNDILARTDPA